MSNVLPGPIHTDILNIADIYGSFSKHAQLPQISLVKKHHG